MGKTEMLEARDREVAGENEHYGAILSGSAAKAKLSPTNITDRVQSTGHVKRSDKIMP